MANWEYKHVVLRETDAEVKVIEALGAEILGTENILNRFGAAGWELVDLGPSSPLMGIDYLVFKRPLV